MPELAEVEYFRKRWDVGAGQKVMAVRVHANKRVFRKLNAHAMASALTGTKFLSSEARGKQMLFHFSKENWLGIHLGMSGSLRVEKRGYDAAKHDHFVLRQSRQTLVFHDPRMFGQVRWDQGPTEPDWWTKLPPPLDSPAFTLRSMREFLARRKRSPIKAALLDQKLFPGVGNWMADEILWQSRLDPCAACTELDQSDTRRLCQKTRSICRTALQTIGVNWSDPPKSWLFHVRWKRRSQCPRDGTQLRHATIAGRTTAWCPQCQSG
ncbi:MAG: DNA-formamidopyrimidine glycosylase family protein [Chthoniobacteraceae bacterium]